MSITLNGTETTVADALAAGTGKLVITGETINTVLNGGAENSIVYEIVDSEFSGVVYTDAPLLIQSVGNTISGSTFSGNQNSVTHGGVIRVEGADSTLTITDSVFDGNNATGKWLHGGALCINAGVVSISGSTFSDNEARQAAIHVNGGVLYLNDVVFSGNVGRVDDPASEYYRYGALVVEKGASVVVQGLVQFATASDFAFNFNKGTFALDGEALLADGAEITKAVDLYSAAQVTPLTVTMIDSENYDKVSFNNDWYVLKKGTVIDTAIITGQGNVCTVTVNGTEYYGYDYADVASALAAYSNVAIRDFSHTGNISAAGTVAVKDSAVTGNISANLLNADGLNLSGRLSVGSGSVIANSTLANGSQDNHGGSINVSGVNISVSNTTFSGNSSNTGHGGALYIQKSANVTLADVTFDGNYVSDGKSGGAIYLTGASITVAGLLTFKQSSDNFYINYNSSLVFDTAALLKDKYFAKVFDFSNGSGFTNRSSAGVSFTEDNVELMQYQEDWYLIRSDAEFAAVVTPAAANQVTIGEVTYAGPAFADFAAAAASGIEQIAAKDVTCTGDITVGNIVADNLDVTGNVTASGTAEVQNSVINGDISANVLDAGDIEVTGNVKTTGKLSVKDSAVAGTVGAGEIVADGLNVSNGSVQCHNISSFVNSTFTNGSSAASGGAIFVNGGQSSYASVTVKNSTFSGNHATGNGGAFFAKYADVELANATFDGNSADGKGGAMYFTYCNITVSGLLTFKQATDMFVINWDSNLTIDTTELLKDKTFAKVMDFSNGSYLSNGSQQEVAFTETGVAMKSYNGDIYVIRDGAEISAVVAGENVNSVTIGGKVYQGPDFADVATAIASGLGSVAVKNYAFEGNTNVSSVDFVADGVTSSGGFVTVGNAEFVNTTFVNGTNANHGGALSATVAGSVVTLTDCTFTGNSSNGNAGALRVRDANITLANVTFDGNRAGEGRVGGAAWFYGCNVTIAGLVSFKQSSDTVFLTDDTTVTIDSSKFLTEGVDMAKVLDFDNGATMNRTDLSGITCTGSDASFVKFGEDYYVVRNTVVDNGNKFEGDGSNLMTGGEVNNYFADKSGAADITTTVLGGKVDNAVVGGAYVAAGNTAENGNVELNIGGTADIAAKVYAGGYLYGNGADSAEAQLKVIAVNVNIDGGAVSGNIFGGAHAREYGNAQVDTVNITVTGGTHGRIYAGGWAEKGAKSYVTTANVTVKNGLVDYLYGGGANADGETCVGTSNITVSDAAVVNTIFMGGRYGYSYVDTVNLTFDGVEKVLIRLSGVSSAGMDYAKSTTVNLATDVTADLIDYVDKFVINEDCTLTANNEFVLGNRTEAGKTDGFTTFDFVTDGLDNEWTAVAGISDFTNAKFSVNGTGLTTWDGKSAIEIGGCSLTYNAEDKTIKLAQVTA